MLVPTRPGVKPAAPRLRANQHARHALPHDGRRRFGWRQRVQHQPALRLSAYEPAASEPGKPPRISRWCLAIDEQELKLEDS